MNISKINLNLLIALDALLSERNVTKAGEKLFLTQSAMSNALNQLRNMFQDDLLIRGGPEGMIPTARALALQPKVSKLLKEIQAVITDQPEFDPATSTRVFTLGMSDHAEYRILPTLLSMLPKCAPHIELKIVHSNYLENDKLLENGEIELAVGSKLNENTQLIREELLPIEAIVAARVDHPLMQKRITMQEYLSARHLRIQYKNDPLDSATDRALQALGYERNVAISLQHVLPALFTLQNNDLLASLPNFITKKLAKKLKLAVQPLPFKLEKLTLEQVWHRQYNSDPGHLWLRNMIKKAVNKAKPCELAY